jgi:hypothetical protein
MFQLLPFSLAPTATWLRATLADWQRTPNMGRNPILVVPALCAAMMSGHPHSLDKR